MAPMRAPNVIGDPIHKDKVVMVVVMMMLMMIVVMMMMVVSDF